MKRVGSIPISAESIAADAKKVAGDLKKLAVADSLEVHSAMQILAAASRLFAEDQRLQPGGQSSEATRDLTETIRQLGDATGKQTTSAKSLAIELALSTSMKMLAATTGGGNECRIAKPGDPFSPLYIVRKPDGSMVWTCDHDPPHETPV